MVTPEDMEYIHKIRPLMKGRQTFAIDANPDTIAEVNLWCKSKGIKYVISTNPVVLKKLIDPSQSLDDWAGSLYESNEITYLFINPLKWFWSVPYGEFVIKRFVSKIISPDEWEATPEFSWELLHTETVDRWFELFQKAILIAVDIETKSFEKAPESTDAMELISWNENEKELLTAIRCVTYTALWEDGNIHSVVIPILEAPVNEQMYWVYWMRRFNRLPAPKIFQNGPYDNAHFLCYAAPTYNYLWDTQSLFHAWYCELPKRLDFVAAFCIHNVFYWKDMARSGGTHKLFEYNARDGWATLVSFLYLVKNLPDWAWKNYLIKFPLWVPCISCNLEGMRINATRRAELSAEYIKDFESIRARFKHWFGDEFNVTPTNIIKLLAFYGSPDLYSSDKYSVESFAVRHPLNARFASTITEYRETAKIISTYLKPKDYSVALRPTKKKSYLLSNGRLFYSLNPDGTDTTRLACSIGFNWTGAQIMNWPAKAEEIRSMMIPDEGFEFFEIDAEQSEARDVAYLSGDKNLIETVESGKDYHALNAERFFGVPYDQIVKWVDDAWKVLDKELRNLSKRTNHGSNYNMTWYMLLLTMGERKVDEAKRLLKLPLYWTRRQVCEYLLESYTKAYPVVKGDYYKSIITTVESTRMLISALGWTRYCFGHPSRNKADHNAYVAHPSQNLSVGLINESFKEIYWRVQHRNPRDFRLKAQIHDSIFGQNRIGRRDLVAEAYKLSIRPIEIADCYGIKRTLVTPMAVKVGMNWQDMHSIKLAA